MEEDLEQWRKTEKNAHVVILAMKRRAKIGRGGAPCQTKRSRMGEAYIHDPALSRTLGVSQDGQRWSSTVEQLGASTSSQALFATDRLAEEAMDGMEPMWGGDDYPEEGGEGEDESAGGVKLLVPRNENSVRIYFAGFECEAYLLKDFPMRTWVRHRSEYLWEIMRGEGRGTGRLWSGGCKKCKYCCHDQACLGGHMYCKPCILRAHCALPLHWVEVSGD
jgi:hypothetical protein